MLKIITKKPNIYLIFQTLSLDVIFGIIAIALFATTLLQVEINYQWILILSLSSWSLYTADHLFDGLKNKEKSVIYRHGFHYKNRYTLIALCLLSALIAIILSFLIFDEKVIKIGLLLSFLSLAYFILLDIFKGKKYYLLQKEIVIAFIYISGIWFVPLIWHERMPDKIILIVIVLLLLLAWGEGIMASYYDYENDIKDNHISFTVLFGKTNTKYFLITLHLLILIICILTLFFTFSSTYIIALILIAIVNLSLLSIIVFQKYFSKNEKYRIFGELTFWLFSLILVTDLF